MRKITVHLDETAYRTLKRLARQRGKPEAALIREAVAQFTKAAPRPPLRSLGIAEGSETLAQHADRMLSEGFGRAREPRVVAS